MKLDESLEPKHLASEPDGRLRWLRETSAVKVVIWFLPMLAGVLSHLAAYSKASLPQEGPGLRLMLVNERTECVLTVWRFLNDNYYIFPLYALALLAALIWLTRIDAPKWAAWIAYTAIALPGFWYAKEACYLAGKLVTVG